MIDIANAVRVREQQLQARDVSFIDRDKQTDNLLDFLNGRIIEGPVYMQSHMKTVKGVLHFKGIPLTDKGSI